MREIVSPLAGFRSPFGGRAAGGAAWSPAALFAAGEQGAWYDPSDFSTMYQDNFGTMPVTAVGQTVGLILRPDAEVSPTNLVTNGTFDTNLTGWTAGGGTAWDAGTALVPENSTLTQTVFVVGLCYEVTFTTINAVGKNIRVIGLSGSQFNAAGNGTFTFRGVATATSLQFLTFAGATWGANVDNVVVKQISGFGAYQQAATREPLLQETGGVRYLIDDGIDDSLNWTAPAGTNYTVAWVDSAGTVTIQTAQSLSGITDMLRATQTAGYVAVNRALTTDETAKLTAYLEGLA